MKTQVPAQSVQHLEAGVLERLYRVAAGHQPKTNGRKLTTTLEYFHGLSLSKLDQAILKKYPNLTSKDKDKASRELAFANQQN